ncbi:MAG: hypothetical protein LBT02_02880 [Rickettsiales bacterium]|jgi:hypothetical protein|nr:hypothetical protein [Rickettsiales bacterium]
MGALFKFLLLLFLLNVTNINAATRLFYPDGLKTESLNKDDEAKFSSANNTEDGIPNQYKGELKYTEVEPESRLDEGHIVIHFGSNMSYVPTIKIKAKDEISGDHFHSSQNWKMSKSLTDMYFSYNFGIGLYWLNGLIIEFEYSQTMLDIITFTDNFDKIEISSDDGTSKKIPFNEYLQTGAVLETMNGIEILKGNTAPLLELNIKSYFLNVTMEQTVPKDRIRPYFGFGFGFSDARIVNLVGDTGKLIPSGQIFVGFVYPLSEGKANLYFGYKGFFMTKIKKKFTRVVKGSCDGTDGSGFESVTCGGGIDFEGTIYNPEFETTEHEYNFSSHNFNVTSRFFF